MSLIHSNFLVNATLEEFSETVGVFLVRLYFIHPFREGNGRVQRLLVSLSKLIANYLNLTLTFPKNTHEFTPPHELHAIRRAQMIGP